MQQQQPQLAVASSGPRTQKTLPDPLAVLLGDPGGLPARIVVLPKSATICATSPS